MKKRQGCTPTVIHTQKHLIRQQKLWRPKFLHHPASIRILDLTHYSSLSHLTCCTSSQTSLHSSAPEHEHTALLFSVTCHFKFSPLFIPLFSGPLLPWSHPLFIGTFSNCLQTTDTENRLVASFPLKKRMRGINLMMVVFQGESACTRVTKVVKSTNTSKHLQLHQTNPILPPTPQFSWLSIVCNKRTWHFELEAVMDRFWGQRPLPV